MEKYCLFHIEGGLGKNVAATAVATTIVAASREKGQARQQWRQ